MPRNRWWGLLVALALFALNFWIAGRLLRTEYTRHMHSIEGAYMAISRLLIDHWHELAWWPVWYLGIPWQNSYPPVLHVAVAAVAALLNISTALSHHVVTGTAYCLGPVALYWLAERLGASRFAAAGAALFYSLFSPSIWLIPHVRHDVAGLLSPRRFHALVYYGEGPHITSMTLLLFALLLLDLAMERKRPWWWFAAAVAMAVVVLTNWLGGFALAAGVLAVIFARDHSWRTRAAVFAAGLWAYCLAAPWIPPTTLLAVRTNAQRVGGAYAMGFQHALYAILAVLVFGVTAWLVRRQPPIVRFIALFTLLVGGITLAAEYFGVALLPQPERYHLEFEIGIALAVGVTAAALFARARDRKAWVVLGVIVLAVVARQVRIYARDLVGSPVDITRTIEYQTARWFEDNMKGRRVMAPGSISFWMNNWTDTPQLMGGFDQGITNGVLPGAHFQIYSGMDSDEFGADLAIAWLQVYGIHAISVGGPQSREAFKPFRLRERFAGLRELHRDEDDVIYEVPQRASTLAWLMRPEDLIRRHIAYTNSPEVLQPYITAIRETAQPADWRWTSWNEASAAGNMPSGRVLSVQVSYHPGWEAFVGNRQLDIGKDELGLMYVEPKCAGSCEVTFRYTGAVEMQLARAAHFSAIGIGSLWLVVYSIRRFRR